MDHLLKSIPFLPEDDGSKYSNFEQEHIDISDKDTIVFYWIKDYLEKNPETCYTYARHKLCDEHIKFYNMEKYKVLQCVGCGLRKEFPIYLNTINDFKKYFQGKDTKEKEIDRSELIDLE